MRSHNPSLPVAGYVLALLWFIQPLCSSAQDLEPALAHARNVYAQQGPKAALPEYESLLADYRKVGDRRGEAITVGLIGNCYKHLGDYPKALELLKTALQIKRELHDQREEGKTLSHLGLLYWDQGKYPEAIASFNESISIARELHDAQLEGASLNNLGMVYDEQGDYRDSLAHYEQAAQLHRSMHFEEGESDALGNIGGVHLLLGRYSQAEPYYRRALAIDQRLMLKPRETVDLGNLAQCQLGQGRIREALDTYEKAISIAKDAGLAKEHADWLRGKASALLRTGAFEDALQNNRLAGEIYMKNKLQREQVENLGDVGNLNLVLGNRASAEKDFQEAIILSTSIGHQRGVIVNRLALSWAQWQSGDYSRAQTNASAALTAARRADDSSETVTGLLLEGKILRSRGQIAAAITHTQDALARARRDGLRLLECEALEQSAELHVRRGDADAALLELAAARQIAEDSGDVDLLWKVQFQRGQSFEMLKRFEEAVQAYQSSIATIERVRANISSRQFRTGYLQNKQQVYIALARLLIRLGQSDAAFQRSEQLRKYSFQVFREAPFASDAGSSPNPELQNRAFRLQELIWKEENQPFARQRSEALDTYKQELQKTRSHDSDEAALPSAARSDVGSPDAAAIAASLSPDAALIEYLVGENDLSIFVLTHSGLRVVTQPIKSRDLESKVDLFRDLLAQTSTDAWRKPAASLRSILITPLENRHLLTGIRSLILVPHGHLNYLPFAALPRSVKPGSSFLIEQYDISEIPAAALIYANPPALLLPVPLRAVSFAPSAAKLKFAILEANSVARSFTPAGIAITGRAATKAQFKEKAPLYDVVHIAAHGFFNKFNPSSSGLQLQPDATDDGKLQISEILSLHLNARLITLSACETGLGAGEFGELPAGDEFVGLSRTFLEAGSDAVLASLWKVDDRSTLRLMNRLYYNLGRVAGSTALASAQRDLIRSARFKHPYYWAAFVLMSRSSASMNVTEAKIAAEKQ
jgi:CHAT domain-containing protein/tetratricopeptide (TPR) repeat protein